MAISEEDLQLIRDRAATLSTPAATSPDATALVARVAALEARVAQSAQEAELAQTRARLAAARAGSRPMSDAGSPAPVRAHSSEMDPWRIPDSDAKAIIREKGIAAAGQMWKQQYFRALGGGRKIRLK